MVVYFVCYEVSFSLVGGQPASVMYDAANANVLEGVF